MSTGGGKRAVALCGLVCALILGAAPLEAQPRDSDLRRDAQPRDSDLRRDAPRDARRALDARRGPPASLRESVERLTPRERRVVRRRLRNMPAPRRQQFFRRWESLGEGERQTLIDRFRSRLERAPRASDRPRDPAAPSEAERRDKRRGGDRDRVKRNRDTWRQMERGDQERMKKRLRRFGTLTPEQQRNVVERRFGNRSEEEREQILERLRAAAERLD